MTPQGWESTKEAAAKLVVTESYVRRLCRDGSLECERTGRDWLVRRGASLANGRGAPRRALSRGARAGRGRGAE
jgi:excisionase family DNA binding protein